MKQSQKQSHRESPATIDRCVASRSSFLETLLSALFSALFGVVLGSLVAASTAVAQQPLPIQENGRKLSSIVSELNYTVDLGTLPPRPVLVVEVDPDHAHSDIQLEIEMGNFVGILSAPGACPGPSNFVFSDPVLGPTRLEYAFYNCDPDETTFDNAEMDITIRVLSFGSGGAPAAVDVSIVGITQVATNTLIFQVETDLSPQTQILRPFKDTTLYRSNTTGSNGAGTSLWVGAEVEFVGSGSFGFWSRRALRPLLAFNVAGALPFNAIVSDADLTLWATSTLAGGGGVSVYSVAPDATGSTATTWAEGNAIAPGDQFSPGFATSTAANWNYRTTISNPWTTPGGDLLGSPIAALNITGNGFHTFSSAGLDSAVQEMVDTGEDDDGFLMAGPGTSLFDFEDRGVRFYSSEVGVYLFQPQLAITYVPAEAWSSGTVNSGVVSFTNEGDNFRWIYDLDQDDILITDIGGVCEVVNNSSGQQNYFPYTYSYGGPAYTGVDCCTWQTDSAASGTVGTGQALFFHGLDASDPANDPPDFDGDGIKDLCDNCAYRANGPFLGSCVIGTTVLGTCNSNFECGPGETCSLSQEDADLDTRGDACPVPEPAFGLGLLIGAAGISLAGLRRRSGL